MTIAVYSEPMVLATATTDEIGSFRQAITIPDGLAIGSHSFVAAGVDKDGKPRALRLDVTIAGQSGSGGGTVNSTGGTGSGTLPITGTAVVWLILIGAGATLAGAALRSVKRQ